MSAAISISEESSKPLSDLEARLAQLEQRMDAAADPNALTLLMFSGELDKLMAAFTMATGAAASGMQVTVFCTFWGTAALKARTLNKDKSLMERAFGMLLPAGLGARQLSRLQMGGLGRYLISKEMRAKNISELPDLIEMAGKLGVKLYVCEMSMDLMGIRREELLDYPHIEYCGVVQFMDLAARANTTMFI